ncbi:MAG: pentapeptide repeat-containing protein [Ignavibacteria bacterium]|nr:pentapeptide repeat-containing protein [Ignavibacteria bacterium]
MKPIKLDSPFSFLPLALITFSLLFFIGITGCKNLITDDNVNSKMYPALSEEDFANNPNLRAKAGSVIGINLEDVDSPHDYSISDTDTTGEDLVSYRFLENSLFTFRMESFGHYDIRFFNKSTKSWVFYINPFNNNITLNIPAGDYEMYIYSWQNYIYDSAAGRQTLFIQPEGSVDPAHYKIFIGASCRNCDLRDAKLNYMHFNAFDFTGADFSRAQLNGCVFLNAHLVNTNLSSAYLFEAILTNSDLSYSNMKNIVLRSTDLRFANLGGSDLSNADLRFANASGTNFCGSNLTGIIYNGITVNEQTQCFP